MKRTSTLLLLLCLVAVPVSADIVFKPNSGGGTFLGGTVTSPILFPDGTAAAPSISFSSDTNTGLFWRSADILSFATGGTERWVINGSGSLNPVANNTYDFGTTGAMPRDISVGRNVAVTGDVTADEVIPTTTHPFYTWMPVGTGAGITGVGTTMSATGTATNVAHADGHLLNYSSVATSGQSAGWNSVTTGVSFYPSHLPDLRFTVQDVAEANYRIWVAASNSGLNVDTPAGGTHVAGFRVSSVAGDTNWKVVVSDGVTPVVTDTLVAFSTAITRLRIQWVTTSSVKFYINGALVHTAAASLPGTSTSLVPYVIKYTTENVAKNFRIRNGRLDLMGVNF